ncbi:hypothetical protein N5C46_10530 [Rossellomorea vietnamensis]|uniref:Uncharacterized protein n=1 Tax=Rossellomorea vietnamensis TaxID=218284 RepID=A0ACD4CDU7_9BACI|nr:hypothetical protein [Rossellomorea vietnamensis]UXH46451.1 hypothetical protein N5C46_10530 [Rossellomorea vietnamensis]
MNYQSKIGHHGNSDELLKYYDSIETSSSYLKMISNSGTSETPLDVALDLKRICSHDRIELIATTNWLAHLGGSPAVQITIPRTDQLLTTNLTPLYFLLEVPITFNVYRDGVSVYKTTDYRTLLYNANIPSTVTSITGVTRLESIALRPVAATSTGTPPAATTTFQFIDQNPSKEEHVYTISAQVNNLSLVTFTPVLSTTSTDIPAIPVGYNASYGSLSSSVSFVSFSGKVFDKMENFCKGDYE